MDVCESIPGLALVEPIDFSVSPRTRSTVLSLSDAVANSYNQEPDYPHIILEHQGRLFTSVSVFLRISAPGVHVTAINKSQLRGKKIAFQFGTNAQSYVLELLKKYGLTTSQVDLVNIPATSYVSAIKSGSVNFIVTENPLTPQYLSEIPGAKVIYNPGIASGRLWLVADRDAVANPAKSAAIASYLQHLSQALAYVNGHEKQWAPTTRVSRNIMPAVLPSGLELFVDHVVPILRSRGFFRTEYTGRTLREHYGLPRPTNRHLEVSDERVAL